MTRLIVLAAALPIAALAQVAPQPAPVGGAVPPVVTGQKAHAAGAGPVDGRALFHEKCGMCHEAMGMGTGLLARRLGKDQPAELEKRTDLDRDYVLAAVRAGIGNMPAIPRGEASDAQLGLIADYLTRKGPR